MSEGLAYFIRRGLNGHRPSARRFAPDPEIYRKVIRTGLPLSGSSFAEASGFHVLAWIIGSMGTKALSSWGNYYGSGAEHRGQGFRENEECG